jgi:hypothetical protein
MISGLVTLLPFFNIRHIDGRMHCCVLIVGFYELPTDLFYYPDIRQWLITFGLDGRQSFSLTEPTRAEVICTIIWARSLLLKFCY